MGEQGMRRLTHRGAKKVETSQPISEFERSSDCSLNRHNRFRLFRLLLDILPSPSELHILNLTLRSLIPVA